MPKNRYRDVKEYASADRVYGINPVYEFLKFQNSLEKILVANGRTGDEVRRIVSLASERHVSVEFREKTELDRIAGANSQGVVGIGRPFRYSSLEDLLIVRSPFRNRVLLILDSVEDPRNLGALIRTAYAFAAQGVVISRHRAASVSPVVVKASAGTAGRIPIAMVANISQSLDYLKKEGFWIYGTEARSGSDINSLDLSGDIGLVMGSEGEGMHGLVRKKCDFLVSIAMPGDTDSLNVSVAAGIILNEISRKRPQMAENL